jgi:hypothetical protein
MITELKADIMTANVVCVYLVLFKSLLIPQFLILPILSSTTSLLPISTPPPPIEVAGKWNGFQGVSSPPQPLGTPSPIPALIQPPSFTHDKATLYQKWKSFVLSNDISK